MVVILWHGAQIFVRSENTDSRQGLHQIKVHYLRGIDVMKENESTIEKLQIQEPRFLLCDTTGNIGELASPEDDWIVSPIRCLDRATDENPGIIMIRFGKVPLREREALVELAGVLKQNSHARNIPVLALLHSKHRKLLEYLHLAGVDYAHYVGEIKLASFQMHSIIDGLGLGDRLERQLATLCHFLHYSKIDLQHEMPVCGAYRDRMVLGGRRLHEICETEGHLHCEYFLNPKRK